MSSNRAGDSGFDDQMGEKPHIVAVPYPGQGHLPPILHLSRKLACQGFIVTIVNIDSIHRNLKRNWICPPGLDIRLDEIVCNISMPMGVDAASIEDWEGFIEATADNLGSTFKQLMMDKYSKVCCIISDYFLKWSVDIATTLKIPAVVYWPGNAAWCSMHHHVNLLVSEGDCFDEGLSKEEKIISYIPGVDPFSSADLPQYFRKPLDDMGWKLLIDKYDRMKDAEWILVNSLIELEPRTFDAMKEATTENFVSVGPLFPLIDEDVSLPVSLRAEDIDCLKWLDTQEPRSVLYISFGSIAVLSDEMFQELASAIESSEQTFLWVIRPDIVKSGTTELYSKFKERTKTQGLTVSWAPQLKVLAHPATGGFLTHCGWNSTFESMCHGVPMIGWPCLGEQKLNCALMEQHWKVGKRMSNKDLGEVVERTEIERVIREFFKQDDEMNELRQRATDLKKLANNAVAQGGSSQVNLQNFISAMKKSTSSSL